jgi:hypothetical protein
MTWLRRGAASVLNLKFGYSPYSIGSARVLLIRDRASANGLEVKFLLLVIGLLIYSENRVAFNLFKPPAAVVSRLPIKRRLIHEQ